MTGILVVSFGTSYDETREKNIAAIEQGVAELGMPVYRAFTSNIIRKVLAKREIYIKNVSEAMQQMKQDGIQKVMILPTHLLYGFEYEKMMDMIQEERNAFEEVKVAKPLLSTQENMEEVLRYIHEEIIVEEGEALALMGHGTEHFSNAVYPALNYIAKEQGYPYMFIGTVEGYPMVDKVIETVQSAGYSKVLLTPFMLVAGDHACNDMASEEEDSWKTEFEKAGIEVRVQIKGLGEYVGIRNMYMNHLKEIL